MQKKQLDTVQAEWRAALDDARFEVTQVRLYPFPGEESEAGNRAYYFTPGQRLHYHANFPDEAGGQLEDANKHFDRHRIAVWVDTPAPILGARVRHELEHGRQVETFGNHILDLNDLVLAVLWTKLEGLCGSGQLYNAIPVEVDANAPMRLRRSARSEACAKGFAVVQRSAFSPRRYRMRARPFRPARKSARRRRYRSSARPRA